MAADFESDDGGFGVAGILKALRRRWWIVALCVSVTPAAALAFSLSQEKQYSATATLLFEQNSTADQLLGVQTFNVDRERQAATNTALASLQTVYDRTRAALKAQGVTNPSVDVDVSQSGTDDLAKVVATDPDARTAALTATTFAEQFVAFRREGDRATVSRALELINDRITRLRRTLAPAAEINRLKTQQEQLANIEAVRTGNVQLVQRAELPDGPSTPRTRRNVALGIFLGGLLGIALALLIDRLDRRISDEAEIEETLHAPVLGVVPESKAITRQKGGLEQLRPADVEAFRLLRAELRYFEASKDASSILVTSSAPGEGKSTVAWNLALTASDSGARTLLIEADLRRPVLAMKMGATPGERGLSTVLSEQVTLSEAVHHYDYEGFTGDRHTFDVLFAGPKPPNPGDLLEGENMAALLRELRRRYDYIVVDSAPVTVVSDAIPLLSQVDGVLVVARIGRTDRDELGHLRRQLTKFSAPVLGVVINGGGPRVSDYAGYGGYGYAAASAAKGSSAQLVEQPGPSQRGVARDEQAGGEPTDDEATPEGNGKAHGSPAADAADFVRQSAARDADDD